MKLIPASSAPWMMRIESSWSVLPQAPNIIAPRHRGLTLHAGPPEDAVLHRPEATVPAMLTRSLGRDGPAVSAIGFGAWPIGAAWGGGGDGTGPATPPG